VEPENFLKRDGGKLVALTSLVFFSDRGNQDRKRSHFGGEFSENDTAFGSSPITPSAFTLLKLTQKDGGREIVEGSGSAWGTTMGAGENARRGFTVEQVRAGVFELSLAQPLAPGEYAFSMKAGTFFDFGIGAAE
jgi:hypothetical protein